MEVEKEGCRLCGASEVRDGRSVCDACLGFGSSQESNDMRGRKKQKVQEDPAPESASAAVETEPVAGAEELQTVDQEIPESKLDLRICEDCKGEFLPYVNGCVLVTSVCAPCLKGRMQEKESFAKTKRNGTSKGRIILDMRKFKPELQTLSSVAAEQLRTIEDQALWMLLECLRGSRLEGVG